MLKRRRWWILSAACVIPIGVAIFASRLPDRYASQATLLIVQQQVSQRYVQPDSASIAAALQAMKLEILSRSQLRNIIADLGLYGSENGKPVSEAAIDGMLGAIDIEPLGKSPQRDDFDA